MSLCFAARVESRRGERDTVYLEREEREATGSAVRSFE